ncbi:hypothetical protein B0H19DRAFT_1065371 [Mycena capillaripes]|nr:hypothetical protein B0H19DRAFT_1065371 [Mycena capillaripes]
MTGMTAARNRTTTNPPTEKDWGSPSPTLLVTPPQTQVIGLNLRCNAELELWVGTNKRQRVLRPLCRTDAGFSRPHGEDKVCLYLLKGPLLPLSTLNQVRHSLPVVLRHHQPVNERRRHTWGYNTSHCSGEEQHRVNDESPEHGQDAQDLWLNRLDFGSHGGKPPRPHKLLSSLGLQLIKSGVSLALSPSNSIQIKEAAGPLVSENNMVKILSHKKQYIIRKHHPSNVFGPLPKSSATKSVSSRNNETHDMERTRERSRHTN